MLNWKTCMPNLKGVRWIYSHDFLSQHNFNVTNQTIRANSCGYIFFPENNFQENFQELFFHFEDGI